MKVQMLWVVVNVVGLLVVDTGNRSSIFTETRNRSQNQDIAGQPGANRILGLLQLMYFLDHPVKENCRRERVLGSDQFMSTASIFH